MAAQHVCWLPDLAAYLCLSATCTHATDSCDRCRGQSGGAETDHAARCHCPRSTFTGLLSACRFRWASVSRFCSCAESQSHKGARDVGALQRVRPACRQTYLMCTPQPAPHARRTPHTRRTPLKAPPTSSGPSSLRKTCARSPPVVLRAQCQHKPPHVIASTTLL